MKKLLENLISRNDSDNIKRAKVEALITDNNGNTIGYKVRIGTILRDVFTTSFSDIKKNDFIMLYTPKNIASLGQILSGFKAVVEDGQTVVDLTEG